MRLQTWMRREGLDAPALAARSGLNAITIKRLLAGKHYPQADTLRKLILVSGGAVSARDFIRSEDAA